MHLPRERDRTSQATIRGGFETGWADLEHCPNHEPKSPNAGNFNELLRFDYAWRIARYPVTAGNARCGGVRRESLRLLNSLPL